MSYEVGDTIRLTNTYRDPAGQPIDPFLVSLTILRPDGTRLVKTYSEDDEQPPVEGEGEDGEGGEDPTGGEPVIQRTGVGQYHYDHLASVRGEYNAKWHSIGGDVSLERHYVVSDPIDLV